MHYSNAVAETTMDVTTGILLQMLSVCRGQMNKQLQCLKTVGSERTDPPVLDLALWRKILPCTGVIIGYNMA